MRTKYTILCKSQHKFLIHNKPLTIEPSFICSITTFAYLHSEFKLQSRYNLKGLKDTISVVSKLHVLQLFVTAIVSETHSVLYNIPISFILHHDMMNELCDKERRSEKP